MSVSESPARGGALRLFKIWFWRPPRPHGQTIVDRRVNPLELLYDLVYAAVIAQAANHLAAHVSAAGGLEFTLVFSLTWIAWTNGSLYLELHGRNDGRTRTYFFLQIGILAILAVFAADTSGGGGSAFAIAYSAFLAVMTWLWYTVRRQDIREHRDEFLGVTAIYVVAMAASVVVILVSAAMPSQLRFGVWAAFTIGWAVLLLMMGRTRIGLRSLTPTDSLVDRFGTFTLIVLGQVVFGVVDGLSKSQRDFETIATGMAALVVGFGLWWIYFDIVGGRLPKRDGGALANWILSHYPITLSIAGAGAGMVSLLEHAHDARTPAPSSWLLSGAVAVGLVSLIPLSRALADTGQVAVAYRPIWIAMAAGAALSLIIGWTRPSPWLLALLLVMVLMAVWAVAFRCLVLAGLWATEARTR
jgi:low temperature requirement protein LtrA